MKTRTQIVGGRETAVCATSEFSAPYSSLLPNHIDLLIASAISPEVSRERGYRTETVKAHAQKLGFGAAQCCTPALLIPLFNVRGDIAGYQLRPDRPRVKDGKAVKYETPHGMRMMLDCHPRLSRGRINPNAHIPGEPPEIPPLIADPTVPLLITEGIRKADAAVSIDLCCIALLGVWNWRGSNDAGGKAVLPDWEYIPLNGRTVVIAYDSDVMLNPKVHAALARLKPLLESRGARVSVIYLPDGHHGEKVGLDDWIAARKLEGQTDDGIRQALFSLATSELRARPGEDPDGKRRPSIFVNQSQLRDKVSQALVALVKANNPAFLFCRGGILTRLRNNDEPIQLEELDDAGLFSELSEAADWYKYSRNGEELDVDPPANLVRGVRGSRHLPFPIIDAIVRAPFFTPEGTLITTSGYHPDARVYLALEGELERQLDALVLPDRPTPEEVSSARAILLDELFHNFPFVDEASRAHAVALTLLPLVRKMIDGPTPNHAVTAPGQGQGTGKGLLVEAACTPGLGEIAAIPETRDDDELRKLLLAILIEGSPIALLDNRKHEINSGVLAAVLTARQWQDRILGKSKTARLNVLTTWVITGNALRLSGEMARRTISIRLNANMPDPWKRTGFKHELPGWAHEHRADLIRACIILVRNWLALGRPPGTRTLGSYEAWARLMGGIIEAAAIPGFLAETAQSSEDHSDDQDANRWNPLITGWWEQYREQPRTPKDLLDLATELVPETEKSNERGRTTRLGNSLKQIVGQAFAIDSISESYLKVVRKDVERRGGGPHSGYALSLVPKTGVEVGEVGAPADSSVNAAETNKNSPANLVHNGSIPAEEVGEAEVLSFKRESGKPPTRPTFRPHSGALVETEAGVEEIEDEV